MALALCAVLCAAQAAGAGAETTHVITLQGDTATSEAAGVHVDGSILTITQGGQYRVTGSLTDGQLIVDAPDENVTLVLAGASLRCGDGAPLIAREADALTIVLEDGTDNALEDGAAYADGGKEADAALFSKADLVLRGEGSLTVTAHYADGIASRDTLLIESGSITVHATGHGIKGKDYLIVRGGDLTIDAGGDGMKATNDTQAQLGYLQVEGGALRVSAGDDGLSAVTRISVLGGVVDITTQNNGMKSDGAIDIQAGQITIQTADDDFVCESLTGSAAAQVTVNGEAVAF